MRLLKRKLLFVLTSDVNLFETNEAFSYWDYPALYWRLSEFKPVSVRGAVNGLIKSGTVTRIVRDGEPKFRLTAVGRDQLLAIFPVSQGRRRWDRTWRVIILNRGVLSQRELRRLRISLREMGFVALEAGVFVSPMAESGLVKRRLVEINLMRAVTMVETKRFVIGDDRAFAERVWNLDKIVQAQKNLISQSVRVLEEIIRAKTLTDRQKIAYRQLLFEWWKLLLGVPGLPLKLLPGDWPHLETLELMVRLGRAVRELEEEQPAHIKYPIVHGKNA